jgi:hypothetical protein
MLMCSGFRWLGAQFVLLRITKPISGSIDGIQLEQFEVGQLYVVGTAVGSYLLALGVAEPASEEGPVLAVPPLVRWEAGERRLVPPGRKRRRSK